jgi:AhpD family alkylhydroperoxidase
LKPGARGGRGTEDYGHVLPPEPLPRILGLLLSLVEGRLGKPLLANRILAWYPKAMLGSGLLEALVAHEDREVPKRLLKLLRIYVSFLASCPFCIDMNAKEYRESGLSDEEILALRGLRPIDEVASIRADERAALAYARCMTVTPVAFPQAIVDELHARFSDRAIVIIASTCAQVNFWARLIQGLGVPPAGFSAECAILELDKYRTIRDGPRP